MYIDDDGILTTEFLELQKNTEDSDRLAELFENAINAILEKSAAKKYNLLLDVSRIEGFQSPSTEARERYVRLVTRNQVKKTALVGLNPLYKSLAYFLAKVTGKMTSIGFFATSEKAIKWLQTKSMD